MTASLTPAQFDNLQFSREFRWKNTELDVETIHQRAFAGFYTERPFDEPDTYNPKEDWMKEPLSQAWGITGAADAHQVVRTLLSDVTDYGQTDFVLPLAYRLIDVPEDALGPEQIATEEFIVDFCVARRTYPDRLLTTFKHLLRVLRSDSFAAAHAPALPTTTVAWDIMRVQKVGGWATRLGWFSDEEWTRYCEIAVELLRRYFDSWADAASSFWWGRMVWSCDSEVDVAGEMEELSQLLATYLTHPDSPWVRFPLHSGSGSNLPIDLLHPNPDELRRS